MFNPDLAISLNNLSIDYSFLGRHEEALVAIRRAVILYDALVQGQPAVFNPNLANSLTNLSNCHSNLGQHEEAFTAIKRAIEL